MSPGPPSVCALPNWPRLAHGQHFNRGYCDDHGNVAVIEQLEEVCGFVDQIARPPERIAHALEERRDS